MSHVFLITHKKFYGQNVLPWEYNIENVTSYSNHNWAYTVKYRQLQFTVLLLRASKWFGRLKWNFEFRPVE